MNLTASGDNVLALIEELRSAGTFPAEHLSLLHTVPRTSFIPARMWVQENESGPYEPVDRTADEQRWLRAVHSNRVIVTQFDDGATEWPDVGTRPTCSASMPSAVLGMLSELNVQQGQSVLEIGTGTGWNAALLSSMVGEQGNVDTVEIDAVMAAEARRRLDAAGFADVRTHVADAASDTVAGVFDRVIATAGIHIGQLPYWWVDRTRPGGVILAPMRADLASGPLVRFVVGDDGIAHGRAADMQVGFMEMRSQRVASSPVGDQQWDDPAADLSHTDLSPWVPLLADDHRWPIAVAVPSCRSTVWKRTDERSHGVAWLRDPLTGSWASVVPDKNERFAVRQYGPRRLWDEAEVAYRWWQKRGEPPLSAWRWTISPDRQSITLDS
ncbi:methyltransferase domain-containing protein [Amycolatopsis anabasis]|uniref:methyltransferase domain-containing protein n=1 Tax=Amycolatopsis anabasis TaxID=1840409 RepID=UPI001FE7A770|nr:methyltransferase domain-containing protein [Amycolatopsis anabasis]